MSVPGQNEVELLLTVRDQASRELATVVDSFGRPLHQATEEVARFSKRSSQELATLDTNLARTAKSARALALPIVAELSPALGQTTGQIVAITAGSLALASGWGALALAGAGLAGIVGGKLVEAWQKARAEEEAFKAALYSFDAGRVGSQIDAVATRIHELRNQLRQMNEEAAKGIWGQRYAPGARAKVEKEFGIELDRSARLRAEQQRIRDADFPLAMTPAELQAARAENVREMLAAEKSVEDVLDFTLDPLARQIAVLTRRAGELRRGGQDASADRVQKAIAKLRSDADIGRRFAGLEVEDETTRQYWEDQNLIAVERSTRGSKRWEEEYDRRTQEMLEGLEQQRKEAEDENLAKLQTDEGTRKQQRADALETADLLRQTVAIQLQRNDLTERERAVLEAIRIERERDVALQAQGLSDKQRELIIIEAHVRATARLRQEFERSDFFAGFSKGLRESEEDLRSWGRAGEDVARGFAYNSQRFFSDLLFAPLERGWKRALVEVPQQLAMSTLRQLTDLFGRFATGQLVGAARQAFPSLAAGGTTLVSAAHAGGLPLGGTGGVALAGLAGGATSVGQVVMTQGGQLALATPQGLVPVQAAPGGGFSIPNVPLTSLGNVNGGPQWLQDVSGWWRGVMDTPLWSTTSTVSGLSAAALEGGTVAAMTASEAALVGGSAATGATTASVSTAGMTVGAALGAVGAGIGLAFTVYGALQGPPTAENIVMSAVSGAVSGAVLGAIVGGPPGAVVGAIAGAVLGGGAAALGKGDDGTKAKRRQGRAQASAGVVRELQAAAQKAADAATAILTELGAAVRTAAQEADAATRQALQRVGTRAEAVLEQILAGINRDLQAGRFDAITPDRFAELDRLLEEAEREAMAEATVRLPELKGTGARADVARPAPAGAVFGAPADDLVDEMAWIEFSEGAGMFVPTGRRVRRTPAFEPAFQDAP